MPKAEEDITRNFVEAKCQESITLNSTEPETVQVIGNVLN
jgi:hypothetical protein